MQGAVPGVVRVAVDIPVPLDRKGPSSYNKKDITEGANDMSDKKTFYITTPIYYPSGSMHIGHTYTTVAADTMTRFKKMTGYDTYFLTGTDEHGQKIERKAAAAGLDPKGYIDPIVDETKALWKMMEIEYDDFIRTTDERHVKAVQKIFKQFYDQGDIYKSEYEGQYCADCEAFWTPSQLKEGNGCPDCGRPTELVREESYFFKMSKYQDWLIDYIQKNPEFIQPVSRANEMLHNFLRPGLQDLCVSRTSFKWGVQVDFDPRHVVYVWIDALSNYITALGYDTEDDSLMQRYWPANVQLVGKEIVRFHTIYWPIMLHALGLPLPKQVFAHGWLLFGNDKMSKSKGNVAYPQPIVKRYGADALRYYLMREMPFGSDGNYTNEALLTRVNADLVNDLGNLVSRTSAMIIKYFDGDLPPLGSLEEVDVKLQSLVLNLPHEVEKQMDQLQFSQALVEIWRVVSECNKYIDVTQPWVLGKDESMKERLGTVLHMLAESLRFVSVLLWPFMPSTPERIYPQIGAVHGNQKTWDSLKEFGVLLPGTRIERKEALFPRLDIQAELEALAKDASHEEKDNKAEEEPQSIVKPNIAIDDFDKLTLRVARVVACEKVPKSDKLLKFTLSLGEEQRTVLSGIAEHYQPTELVGKQVVLLANLAPRKIRGILSEGMILCAANGDDTKLKLLTVDGDMEDGAYIS